MKHMVQIEIIHVFSGNYIDAGIPMFVDFEEGF
jgi:hypothetical protein